MKTVGRLFFLLLAGLTILPFSKPVNAQEVKYFYNPDNGNSAYIDLNTIQYSGNTALATVTWHFSDDFSNMGISTIVMDIKADCQKKVLQSVNSKSYSANGTIIKEDNVPETLPIGQASKQEATLDVVCGTKKPLQTLMRQFVSLSNSPIN